MPAATPIASPRRTAVVAAVAAAAAGLGAAELAAGLVQSWRSPVEAVADAVIDRAPASMTRFGIETFGTNDKVALVVGILVILALASVGVGLLARRSRVAGPAAFAVVGAVGLAASADGGAVADGTPSIVAAATGAAVLRLLLRAADRTGSPRAGSDARTGGLALPGAGAPATAGATVASSPSSPSRRQFLGLAGATVALAGVAAAGGRVLRDRFSAAASRLQLALPSAARPLPAAPASTSFDVPGLAPLFTPNDEFYRIDTALTVPQVPAETWRLRVHGMVDEPLEVTFAQLVDRFEVVEVDITLTCVSNPVGGELVGNARWLGVRLRDVLDAAGVDPAADQVVGRSVDGYTCGFPVEAAYDRDAIIAIGMNGEPLPLDHGFPARLVTPGLYGYVSATKWLTEIELTTFADFDQYWVPRGYDAEAPIKMMARIDVPRVGQAQPPGPIVVAGVAWAQTRGIAKVEISVDGGPFQETELADALSDDTWRQWRFRWDASEGNHRLVVRATDTEGELQTEERAEIVPNGTSGWQSRLVTVRAA